MIRFVLATALALTVTGQAFAATVDLNTYTWIKSPAEEVSDEDNRTHDTATDGSLHYRTAETRLNKGDVEGRALSGVDLRLGASRARAEMRKDPNTGGTKTQATATTQSRETYRVSGTGRAQVNFTIYGDFSLLSDVPDLSKFMNAHGAMHVYRGSLVNAQLLSSASPTDPLFGLENGSFNRKLSYIFDVVDGDMFDVATSITADLRMFSDVFGAFDMMVDVKAGLRVFGHDGVVVTPEEGGVGATVPLPASGLLLLSPLAGLIWVRRRRAAQT